MRFMGGGPGGGGDLFGPPVTTRDLETYVKFLGLTREQQETARALVEGVTAEYQPLARSVRDRMEQIREEFRETRDPSVWQGMASRWAEVRAARKKIEESFANDLKAILTPEQAEKWPAVERAQRRTKTLPRGLMSGERVDLIGLVDRLGLSEEAAAALRETLEQYEADLDRELVRRNEFMEKAMEQGPSLMQSFQEGDTEKLQQLFEKGREASARVRDVNRRYQRLIEGLLPEDKRAVFAEDFRRESFPMVYRPSFAARTLDAAEQLPDLDESQKAALADIRASFTREQGAINTRMQAAIEDLEKNVNVDNMFARFNDPAMREMRDAKRQLDEQTIEKVNKVLNEAQRTRLPERDARGEGGRGFRRGGEAGADRGQGDDGPRPQRRGRGQQGEPQDGARPIRTGGPA
jgi:hypothetical protein